MNDKRIIQIQKHTILTLECEIEKLKDQIAELQQRDITIERETLDIPVIELRATEEDRL